MKILVSVPALFPFGSPIASRILNFCRMFISLGHEVVVFCDYLSDSKYKTARGFACFDGIKICYSFEERNFKSKILKQFVTPRLVKNYLDNNKVDLIFATLAADRFNYIRCAAQKKSVPLVLEICEKYHYSNWTMGRLSPRYHKFMHCWNREYVKADAVVAISRLLEKRFKERNKNVVRVPSIIDVKNVPCKLKRENSKIIKFVFSGALGHGKDSLVEFMLAMNNVRGKIKHSLDLNIYGPSKESVKKSLKENAFVMKELGDAVHYHGRIPQNEIPSRLTENDFGIILRPQRESSNAGFPTKFAEYMSAGLSVVANDTGDIGLYLNESNGFLLKDKNAVSIEKAIVAIDSLTDEEMLNLRTCARKTAENAFNYIKYKDVMDELLNACSNCH